MNENLSEVQLAQLRTALEERRSTLLAEIRSGLASSEHEGYTVIAEEVRDLADDAAADVLIDSRLFDIQRDADELKQIREALERMQDRRYGTCVDCGEPINLARLKAQPAAARCIACQARYEREHNGFETHREI